AAGALADSAAAALGRDLLGPVAGMVAPARRLIVALDGALADLPFETLRVGGAALPATHEVARGPGASVLRALRARTDGPAAGDWLVLAGGDAAGHALPGVHDEVDWLAHHLPHPAVRDGAHPVAAAALWRELERSRAIHIAAHTE